MTNQLRSYITPIVILVFGVLVLTGDPSQPFSATVPIVFGQYQNLVGGALIVLSIWLAYCVFQYQQRKQ